MERVNERLAYLSFGWGVRGVLGFRVFGWSGATNVVNELIHERDTIYITIETDYSSIGK